MAGETPRISTGDSRVGTAEEAGSHMVPNQSFGRKSNSTLVSVMFIVSRAKEGNAFPVELPYDLNHSHRTGQVGGNQGRKTDRVAIYHQGQKTYLRVSSGSPIYQEREERRASKSGTFYLPPDSTIFFGCDQLDAIGSS